MRFLDRMRLLFKEGHCLEEIAPGVPGETCTTMAITQAREFGRLYYVDRVVDLWPADARTGVEHAMASIGDVVDAMVDRVEVELPADGVQLCFQAFSIGAWAKAHAMDDGTPPV